MTTALRLLQRRRGNLRDVVSYLTKTVTADNTGGSAKTDWPVKVSLTSVNFTFADAESDGSDVRFFNGSTQVAHWIESWDSVGETATLWVLFPSITAGGTADLEMRYNDGAGAYEDAESTFPALFEDWSNESTFLGDLSTSSAWFGMKVAEITATAVSGSGWKSSQTREQSNVLYDSTDTGKEYKLYITGADGSSVKRIGVFYASDLAGPWTEYASNPIIDSGEDPYVIKVGSTYHLYCESYRNAGNGDTIDHYTSSDGLTWTLDGQVIGKGGTGAFDETLAGSPVVIHDGTTFHMLYEGIDSGANESTGYASSADGSTWTKGNSNPVNTDCDIIHDHVVIGSKRYLIGGNATAGEVNLWSVATTTAADLETAAWTLEQSGNDLTGSGGNGVSLVDGSGQYVTVKNSNTDAYRIFRVIGGDWLGLRHDDGAGPAGNPIESPIDLDGNGDLLLQPDLASPGVNFAVGMYTASSVGTSDIAVRMRRKIEAQATDDHLSAVYLGAGTWEGTNDPANDHIPVFTNAYGVAMIEPTTQTLFRRIDNHSTAISRLNGVTPGSFAIEELRYTADGDFSYIFNGTTVDSEAADTTHLALAKQLGIVQGNNTNNEGGKSTIDWVLVRKYDGVDPSVTVA